MTSPTLLILAAGMGTRYGGLKQVDPVGPSGETIMDYSIYDALRAGFGKLVFVIRKDIEQTFRQAIGARFEDRIAVDYVFQELDDLPQGFRVPPGRTKPWGTAQAILSAARVIHEPFASINADDFYGTESFRLLAAHLQSASQDYALVGFVLRNTLSDFGPVARGVCQVNEHGLLQSVVELTHIQRDGSGAVSKDAAGHITRLTGDELVSMNMWGFTPSIFPQLQRAFQEFLVNHGASGQDECYLPSAVNALVAAAGARVRVLRTTDKWFGFTYREDRQHVTSSINRLIREGHYPERLWT